MWFRLLFCAHQLTNTAENYLLLPGSRSAELGSEISWQRSEAIAPMWVGRKGKGRVLGNFLSSSKLLDWIMSLQITSLWEYFLNCSILILLLLSASHTVVQASASLSLALRKMKSKWQNWQWIPDLQGIFLLLICPDRPKVKSMEQCAYKYKHWKPASVVQLEDPSIHGLHKVQLVTDTPAFQVSTSTVFLKEAITCKPTTWQKLHRKTLLQ